MNYLVYLFCSDESATIMNIPVARIPSADIAELSDEVMREIYITIAKENGDVVDPASIADWTPQQIAEELWNMYTYLFNRAAILPAELEQKVEKRGDKLMERFGDDSATYQAAGDFADYLIDKAITLVDFPEGSGE